MPKRRQGSSLGKVTPATKRQRIFKATQTSEHSNNSSPQHFEVAESKNEKEFNCTKCNKNFKTKYHLKRHEKSHIENENVIYTCTYCEQTFTREDNLERHVIYHKENENVIYNCTYCEQKFNRKDNFDRHVQLHTEPIKFTCTYCDISFSNKQNLDCHIHTQHRNGEFACEYCNKLLSTKYSLVRHLKLHITQNTLKCNLCNYTSLRKANLIRHIESHKVTDNELDSHLGKVFKNKTELSLHKHTNCNDATPIHTSDQNICSNQDMSITNGSKLLNFNFYGIRFINNLNDCFINADLNGLLSLGEIRNIIMRSNATHSVIKQIQDAAIQDGIHDVQALRKINSDFDNNGQHDAGEFLYFLLDILETSIPNLQHTYTYKTKLLIICQQCHAEYLLPDSTDIFLRLFFSSDKTAVQSNGIIQRNCTLQELIDHNWEPKEHEKHCVKCGGEALRKENIIESPKVLFILIMRNINGEEKIKTPVQPSIEIVVNNTFYRLKSIIQHHGSNLNSGHYTTMLNFNNKWLKCNDRNIEQNKNPNDSEGYIYMYELITSSQITCSSLDLNSTSLNIPNVETNDKVNDIKCNEKKLSLNKYDTATNVEENNSEHKILCRICNLFFFFK